MPQIQLQPAHRRSLRADAHHLQPVVMVGNDGLTPGVIKETDAALNAHGLIKVRVQGDDRVAREEIFHRLCDELSAGPVQHIGKLLVLWRPIPEKVAAPDDERKPGPRIVKVVSFSKSGNHRATVKKVRVLGNERITAAGIVKRKDVRTTSVKKRAKP